VPITDPRALVVSKRDSGEATRVRRDPAEMLDLLLPI